MSPAEYASAAADAIIYVKKHVRYRGLNTPGGWIRNPHEVNQKFVSRVASLIIEGPPQTGQQAIDEAAKLAFVTNTGNCSELSAVAFNYLRDKGVRPIDYFAVFRKRWNHAFVILNRNAATPVADFVAWSPSAELCDPLYDRWHRAALLRLWYANMFPLRSGDVYFRLE